MFMRSASLTRVHARTQPNVSHKLAITQRWFLATLLYMG